MFFIWESLKKMFSLLNRHVWGTSVLNGKWNLRNPNATQVTSSSSLWSQSPVSQKPPPVPRYPEHPFKLSAVGTWKVSFFVRGEKNEKTFQNTCAYFLRQELSGNRWGWVTIHSSMLSEIVQRISWVLWTEKTALGKIFVTKLGKGKLDPSLRTWGWVSWVPNHQ